MDGGNWSTGEGRRTLGRKQIHFWLPVELLYVINQYRIMTRQDSLTATIRVLLETHPALTEAAVRAYDGLNTSPRV